MKYCYLDFEFYGSSEEYLTPVCCTLMFDGNKNDYWLWADSHAQRRLAETLRVLKNNGFIFVSYAFEAEARAMQSLGIDPLREKFNCICLYIMYRQLGNKFPEICFGKHLIDGRVKFLKQPPSKWAEEDEDDLKDREAGAYQEMQYSLASATYKFLSKIRDTDDKDKARDRILAGGPFSEADRHWIMRYCSDDVVFLPQLHIAMWKAYRQLIDQPESKFIALSHYAIRTAEMVKLGYPVNVPELKKLTDSVPWLIRNMQRELLEKCRGLELDFEPFTWVKKEQKFAENQRAIKEHIEKNYPHAKRTDKSPTHPRGQISINEDDIWNLRTPEHLPRKFIDYYCEYKWTKKSLSGFAPAKGRRSIWDFMGSDGRVRPYFGIFGAQTSRTQPSSTSFIFLKAAVLRFLVHPKPGRCLIGIDYKSQEFLIGAVLSGDEEMMNAYKSGDAYIFLARKCNAVPQTATKESHPMERDQWKGVELSLGYGQGAASMGLKIGVPTDIAQGMIDARAEVYSAAVAYRKSLVKRYRNEQRLVLPSGWTLGPAQDNRLSMQNFPGQGHGGDVMREAVARCQDSSVDIIQTLHDALYAECDICNVDDVIERMDQHMKQAFKTVLGCDAIKTDIHVWGIPVDKRETRHTPNGTAYECEYRFFNGGKVKKDKHEQWLRFVSDDSSLV